MSPATKRGLLWMQGTMLSVYVIIVVVSILIRRILASNLIMNESNKKMHKQAMKVGQAFFGAENGEAECATEIVCFASGVALPINASYFLLGRSCPSHSS